MRQSNDERLTLKQRMTILSRSDCRGRAKPTALRIFLLLVALIEALFFLNALYTTQYRNAHAAPTPKGEGDIQISFVGDVCLGRYIAKYGEKYGYSQLFTQSTELWGNSDLVFANLECVILDEPENYERVPKSITLPAPGSALEALQSSGVNVLSVANNHAVDYGGDGLAYELSVLEQLGLNYAGAGKNIEEAASVRILQCGDLKIGFLAFSTIPVEGVFASGTTVASPLYADLYRNIRAASTEVDIMIVYAHWGNENGINFNENQEKVAHQLVESGADIVIGSHPHVLQTVETYRNGIIFYSLGNYLIDQGSRENRSTAMVQLNLNQQTGVGELILIPMRINNFSPQVTGESFYTREIQRLLTKGLDSYRYTVSEDGRIHIPVSFAVSQEGK